MGQSSNESIHAGMPADLFSKREIEACVLRVGVQDSPYHTTCESYAVIAKPMTYCIASNVDRHCFCE